MGLDLRTLVAQRHPRPYLIQWERNLRWRQRADEATRSPVDFEPFDFLFALFANIFQMRDWIRGSRGDLTSSVNELFRTSPNLALVRDLANGAKHLDLTNYSVDGAATIACEYGDWGDRYVVPMSGSPNRDALELADASITEVRGFMEAHGLL